MSAIVSRGGSAAAYARALVSGYPRRLWGDKLLMVLQAFADDSTSERGDKRLHVCAYINTAEKWIEFAEAWDAELSAKPRIEYFKTSEAYSGRGQFEGIDRDARSAKIVAMARVVHASQPWAVHSSIDTMVWRRHMRGVAPYGLTHPHYPALQAIMVSAGRVHASRGSTLPIEFIFDEQEGVGKTLALFHDWAIGDWPADVRSIVGGSPVFKNEKQVVHIQAADMLAWHVRKAAEGPLDATASEAADLLIAEGQHFTVHVDEATIARMAEALGRVPGARLVSEKAAWSKAQYTIRGALADGWRPPEDWRVR